MQVIANQNKQIEINTISITIGVPILCSNLISSFSSRKPNAAITYKNANRQNGASITDISQVIDDL
jgi:hypothetical protein